VEFGKVTTQHPYVIAKLRLALASKNEHPTREMTAALFQMARVSAAICDFSQGLLYARQAQKCAELCGDAIMQVRILLSEGRMLSDIGDFHSATRLYRQAQDVTPPDAFHLKDLLKEHQAALHLKKTEYLDGRELLEEVIESRRSYRPYDTITARTDLAEIEIAIDLDPGQILRSLTTAKSQCTIIGWVNGHIGCDILAADLSLREGNLTSAKHVFQESLPLLGENDDRALLCIDRLAEISHRLSDCVGQSRWNGLCIAWAIRTSSKLGTLNALRRMADSFATAGDPDTALALHCVALDGFKPMGVHQRIAQCMVAMATIWEFRGDFAQSVELLIGAKPEFQRASQTKEVARIDDKLKSLQELLKSKEAKLKLI
jgi:tetratricopeptide (TPR) repeat protein